MNKLLWSSFFIVLMMSGCGSNESPTRHNDFTPLTSIEIVAVKGAIQASKTIAKGTSTQLSVIGNFSGLFTEDITSRATWSSASKAVADFADPTNPRVTGHAPGTAILTATVGSLTANFTLTVSNATLTTLTITPANPAITLGLNTQFAATGTFSDLTAQDLTFDATWSSGDPTVATVGDAAGNKGLAQTLAAGITTITATFPFNGVFGSTQLTVTVPVLQSITVTPANPAILSLAGTNFQATGHFSDGTTADLTSQVAWSSSRPDIATIPANGGAATALTQGTTSISATLTNAGGTPVSGTTILKVTGGNLNAITLSPANPILARDTAVRMTATGTFDNGSTRDITALVQWTTTNSSISTVNAPGGNLAFLNAIAATPSGTPTTVTAKFGAVTGTTNLTVTAPALTSIALSSATGTLVNGGLSLITGTSDRFILKASFSDGSTQDVTASATWTSSAGTIASVGNSNTDLFNKGRVTGVADGTATITATFGTLTISAPASVTTRTLQGLAITVVSVSVGNQAQFAVVADYGSGVTKNVTEDAVWTIDKTFVATLADSLNQPGLVFGVDSGSAILTVTFKGKTQTTTVTVP